MRTYSFRPIVSASPARRLCCALRSGRPGRHSFALVELRQRRRSDEFHPSFPKGADAAEGVPREPRYERLGEWRRASSWFHWRDATYQAVIAAGCGFDRSGGMIGRHVEPFMPEVVAAQQPMCIALRLDSIAGWNRNSRNDRNCSIRPLALDRLQPGGNVGRPSNLNRTIGESDHIQFRRCAGHRLFPRGFATGANSSTAATILAHVVRSGERAPCFHRTHCDEATSALASIALTVMPAAASRASIAAMSSCVPMATICHCTIIFASPIDRGPYATAY